ncbi:MAG: alanine--tRNA ligase [bacterium]|nr:alanine--tRNA ligase [bacterium]
MTHQEIRQKFLKYFESKGHTIVPSSSLLPDDPSVLLTTAGMQQFKPYYAELDPTVTVHPSIGRPVGKNATSSQKSFRTSDIDEVGDERHLTFFEMLGNFSFGGYFKKEAITLAHEFITKEMGLSISFVTIFEGKEDIGVPKDIESRDIWKALDAKLEVREQGMDDVFWGPTGSSGPCGPTTEIYCKNGAGEDIEVWNIVFNQFFYPGSREELNSGATNKKLEPLKTPGVDTGMGLERLVMSVQNTRTIFETDLFSPFADILQSDPASAQSSRIVADHLRAATFLLADGVRPSNKEAGYILRRLIRRALVHAKKLNISADNLDTLMLNVIEYYGDCYGELQSNKPLIFEAFGQEREKFMKVLESGLKEFEKRYAVINRPVAINGKEAFDLYQSYGFPIDVIRDLAKERGALVDVAGFEAELIAEVARHREISKAGSVAKFGGHGLLLDTGELKAANEEELKVVTRLHTATHMLQKALREVLGTEVHQAGSDITVERTRFDFTFSRKLTPEEIKKVEDIVNEKVKEDLPMQKVVLPKSEAEKTGALYFFKEKYPDPVNVYFMGNDIESAWSKEFCGGPHVTHSGTVGKFKIAKEEACSSGVRRIRGVVQ